MATTHVMRDRFRPQGIDAFEHYYVGVNSLAELATKDDRVCVLNILGGESRTVTPVSNEYSGGNIVCGTMPGRSGSVMKPRLVIYRYIIMLPKLWQPAMNSMLPLLCAAFRC